MVHRGEKTGSSVTGFAAASRGPARLNTLGLKDSIQQLEAQLDAFDPQERLAALTELVALVRSGSIDLPQQGRDLNLHAHTFFSYNGYGFSPSKFAWLARRRGLAVAGITDFDVLDGLGETREASRLLNLKTCVSLETRVYVPEFATRVVNSPGEPGIAYHMGVGFPSGSRHPFLAAMRRASAERTRELTARVNRYLAPVEVDFDTDVVPLTPLGNVTERHVCEAYERKAIGVFPDELVRAAFWQEKLGSAPAAGASLQGLIRAKTMKKGGAGYVQPDAKSFPLMAEMNAFVQEAGAIPTVAWLDGLSEGEQAIEEYLAVCKSHGAAALNIIPDRNYTPKVRDKKLQNLEEIVALAEKLGLPLVVGTEMNAPGLKFVDDFGTDEIKPLLPAFWRGAHIVYAHGVLQRLGGLGYLSTWAVEHFADVFARNAFYAELGELMQPVTESRLADIGPGTEPAEILAKVR